MRPQRRIVGALVGLGIEDEPADVVGVVPAADQFARQPAEQGGVGVAAALEVPGLFDETAAHQLRPEAVGHHLGEAFVRRRGQQGRQPVARVMRVAGQLIGRALGRELREGPVRLDGRARGEGHLDERLAAPVAELVHRHAAGGGHPDALGLEQRRQREDLLLFRRGRGRVMAARALGVHAQEGGRQHGGLRGHRHVVLRGHAEAGGTAETLATLQADEFGHEEVEWFMVAQAFMDPPAERAGVVQRGVEDVRVLGEEVLPEAHRGVGRARVGQQAIDHPGPLVGRAVGLEGGDLRGRGRHAHHVVGDAAQEGQVGADRGDLGRLGAEFRPVGAVLDPAAKERLLGDRESRAVRRHPLLVIGRADAGEQRALRGITRNDGRAVGFSSVERAGAGVQVQAALRLRALVAFEAIAFEDGPDLPVEIEVGLAADLGAVGGQFIGDEGVDGVEGRKALRAVNKAGGEGRHRDLGRGPQPSLSRLAALSPVVRLRGAGVRAVPVVEGGQADFLLGGVAGPARVIVGRRRRAGSQQAPGLAACQRDRRDRLAQLRPSARLRVDHVTDDGLERDAVFATVAREFAPCFAVARWREAEGRPQVEELVLHLDRLVVGAGGRKGGGQHQPVVDEERRGAAPAQEQPVLAGRQGHLRAGAEEVGTAAVAADAGRDVKVGRAEETEGRRRVAFRGRQDLARPGVLLWLPSGRELDQDLARSHLVPGGEGTRLDHGGRALRGLVARRRGAVVAGVRAGVARRRYRDGERGQGGPETSGEFLGRERPPMHGDLIEPPREAVVRATRHR